MSVRVELLPHPTIAYPGVSSEVLDCIRKALPAFSSMLTKIRVKDQTASALMVRHQPDGDNVVVVNPKGLEATFGSFERVFGASSRDRDFIAIAHFDNSVPVLVRGRLVFDS